MSSTMKTDIVETITEKMDSADLISADLLGAVIGFLHGKGQLTDKTLIACELKKWLPSVADHELRCYTMCIWFTAQCFTRLSKKTTITSTSSFNYYEPDNCAVLRVVEPCAEEEIDEKFPISEEPIVKSDLVPTNQEEPNVDYRVQGELNDNCDVSLEMLPYSTGKQFRQQETSTMNDIVRYDGFQHS